MSAGSAMPPTGPGASGGVVTRAVGSGESAAASRAWWDDEAPGYQAEHGAFLGDVDFVWCPERLREADAALLGPPATLVGARVLEVGCGAASCARWLVDRGADAVGLDLSAGMLAQARAADARSGVAVPLVQADASHLPFPDAVFDLACSAFGAVPFVADTAGLMAEVARVLRPGGRWVFAVNHPMRWIFPDDPGEDGLRVTQSYFDRTPYAEADDDGRIVYVEHHRTLGDRIADVVGAGLVLEGVVEPEWPEDLDEVWGQWSPLRGALFPGTAIFRCRRPGGPGDAAGPAGGAAVGRVGRP
jgi:SAM-dependent methyltransferase